MARTERDAAQTHIDALPEPRRSRMQHLHDLLLEALPTAEVRLWDYSGPLIAYGIYPYSNSKGPAGDWFAVGLANRKAYISLYSMATRDGRYLVEAMRDRFRARRPGGVASTSPSRSRSTTTRCAIWRPRRGPSSRTRSETEHVDEPGPANRSGLGGRRIGRWSG